MYLKAKAAANSREAVKRRTPAPSQEEDEEESEEEEVPAKRTKGEFFL